MPGYAYDNLGNLRQMTNGVRQGVVDASGNTRSCYQAWAYDASGNLRPFLSVLESASASNVSGSSSGPAASGSVATTGNANPSCSNSIGSDTYAWSYISGSGGPTINTSTLQNPTWSNGSVSDGSPQSAVWSCRITDSATGAFIDVQITVTLTWTRTFTPVVHTYTPGSPGTGSETIPSGASHLTIIVVGGGGSGGSGFNGTDPGGGGGGGSGGINSISRAIAPGDWLGTITYVIGSGGVSISGGGTSTSGTVAAGSVTIGAGGGAVGGNGSGGGGPGGTAGSPGGNQGGNGSAGHGASGGAGGTGPNGDGQGAGGAGGPASSSPAPSNGVGGEVIFSWS